MSRVAEMTDLRGAGQELRSNSRKILVLTDWFYPGYKAGGPIQSCRNFVATMEDSFEILVVCSDRDMGDSASYPGVSADAWNDYGKSSKVFYASSLSVQQLRVLLEETAPDFIYLNSMFSLRYTISPLWLLWRNQVSATVVLTPRGMLQAGAIRFKTFKKKLFLAVINLLALPGKMVFQATDPQEEKDIRKYFPRAGKVLLVPDFPRLQLPPLVPVIKEKGVLKCIFMSRLAPKKNLLYFLELLEQVPGDIRLEFEIRGIIEDQRYWEQCSRQIAKLRPNIAVRLPGAIDNDEVISCLQQHHLLVLPTLGENFGHAIFEAFLAGRPVLISDQTPWRNLEASHAGWDMPLADKGGFAWALVEVAEMEQDAFDGICRGAWGLAEKFIQELNIRERYTRLFSKAIK